LDPEQIVGREVVEGAAESCLPPLYRGSSTTNIIETVLEKYEEDLET